ncbi:MAG: cell division protein ZapA [Clostridia bacterium]|nr:cell division protein ZapA [Clostridia bacterium]
MAKQKVEITIRNQNYTLLTDVSPAKVVAIAEGLDQKLDEIMTAAPRITLNQALILTAMDLAQTAAEQKAAADKLKAEIGDYLEDAEKAMTERDKFKRENEKLKEQLKNK